MTKLVMTVHLAGGIESSTPECYRLIEIVDGSPTFDVGRKALLVLRPRKKFDTNFGVTVGSYRAGKGGQYYIGPRDIAQGIAKRDEFLDKQRLCYYHRHYWSESLAIDVGFALWDPTWVSAEVGFREPGPRRWAGDWSDAMFSLFVQVVSLRPPLVAYCSWRREWGHYDDEYLDRHGVGAALEANTPITPGTHTMQYVPPADVAKLGGIKKACRRAPVLDAVPIRHGEASGIAFRLCRDPDELTTDRLTAWREFLSPVLPAVDPSPRQLFDPDQRPLDILPIDFEA